MNKYILLAMTAALAACSNNDNEYDASGVFETTEVIVSAKTSGEIKALNIDEGDNVEKDAQLGFIDTLQLALKKKQLMANISATDARKLNAGQQLASLRQQIANLQHEKARFESLLKDKAASQKQVDDIDYQIEVLQKQVSATNEQVSTANQSLASQSTGIVAQIAQINDQISNSYITCPIKGTVLAKYAEQGEFAAPGKALLKIANISDMKLRAYITADQLTSLKIGQKVKVFADMGEKDRKEYSGTVTWISDKAEFTPKTIQTRDERANLVYAIKISVKNDGLIKRGMYGEVSFGK